MYHSNETWVMMALRELLCYCHIVGPRHLHTRLLDGGIIMAVFLLAHAGRHALDSGLGILKGLMCVLARGIGVLSCYTKLHVSHATRWGSEDFCPYFHCESNINNNDSLLLASHSFTFPASMNPT